MGSSFETALVTKSAPFGARELHDREGPVLLGQAEALGFIQMLVSGMQVGRTTAAAGADVSGVGAGEAAEGVDVGVWAAQRTSHENPTGQGREIHPFGWRWCGV